MRDQRWAVQWVAPGSLNPDPRNARTHPDRNREAVRRSVESFGLVEPLVVQRGTNVVLGGNCRLDVVQELGFESVPVVFVDFEGAQATALALALNRTADLAEWDYDQVVELLREVEGADIPIEQTGWDASELTALDAHAVIDYETLDDEKKDEDEDGFETITVKVRVDEAEAKTVKKELSALVRDKWGAAAEVK